MCPEIFHNDMFHDMFHDMFVICFTSEHFGTLHFTIRDLVILGREPANGQKVLQATVSRSYSTTIPGLQDHNDSAGCNNHKFAEEFPTKPEIVAAAALRQLASPRR
jgi:hypothetical protein